MLDRLSDERPEFGRDLAIDASDMPAYADGQRYLSKNGPEHQTFAGADPARGVSKWRCPTSECKPGSRWIKADRLHPRETKRRKSPLAGRASVEREFGWLKNELALLPLRVRGIERVRVHANLTILAKLACALARTRGAPLGA